MTIPQINFREPKVLVRAGLGVLLFANLVAATFAFHLFGDSPAALDADLTSARAGFRAAQGRLKTSRALIENMQISREQGDKFLKDYMTSRRITFSTIGTEINKVAETAGMKVGTLNYGLDSIENSGGLDTLTITAGFEGGYSQLMKFVNLLDRSPRFLLIESLQVAPLPKGDVLSTVVKLNTFLKDDKEGAL